MDATIALEAKVDILTRKYDFLVAEKASSSSKVIMSMPYPGNIGCSYGDFVSSGQGPQGNPYSATYNLGWGNHPNFAWGGQGRQG